MPQVALPDIVEDCKDAFTWCRANLPEILGKSKVGIDSYVVAGDSAGGTLSTLLGHSLEPKAKVVIDVFGVVDMADKHFYNKSDKPFDASLYHKAKTERELEELVKDRDEGKAETICPWDWELEPQMKVKDLQSFWGVPGYEPRDKDFLRMDAMKYMSSTGQRMTTLLRKDECGSEEEFKERQGKWSSLALLDGIQGGRKGYPPTFILHGTGDSAVPVEQSYRFEKRLKELEIPVESAYCPGGEHCFDNKINVCEHNGSGDTR
jgi:acetyl esterase/lipase